MKAEILPAHPEGVGPPATPAPAKVGPGDLYAALLADAKNPRTERARVQDVEDFARFLKSPGPSACCAAIVAGDAGTANAVGLAYRRHLQDRGLAASTINRRLSTLRRVAELARRFGLVDWALDLEGLKVTPYRDTAGPGLDGWRRLMEAARGAGDAPKARRDRAILRLLHDNALRRAELVALDVEDLDFDGARVAVLGKGRTAKEWMALNAPTMAALREWLDARGHHPGPLFVNFDRSNKPGAGGRLTDDGVHALIGALSRKAGLARTARPHGIRHQAITRACDLTGGNLRLVQRFGRHLDPKTTQHYDDAREDLAGAVIRLLGADE